MHRLMFQSPSVPLVLGANQPLLPPTLNLRLVPCNLADLLTRGCCLRMQGFLLLRQLCRATQRELKKGCPLMEASIVSAYRVCCKGYSILELLEVKASKFGQQPATDNDAMNVQPTKQTLHIHITYTYSMYTNSYTYNHRYKYTSTCARSSAEYQQLLAICCMLPKTHVLHHLARIYVSLQDTLLSVAFV